MSDKIIKLSDFSGKAAHQSGSSIIDELKDEIDKGANMVASVAFWVDDRGVINWRVSGNAKVDEFVGIMEFGKYLFMMHHTHASTLNNPEAG